MTQAQEQPAAGSQPAANLALASHEAPNEQLTAVFQREKHRLRRFIRSRVAAAEVEDVLQDVFCELILAYRLMKPVEHAGAWLYRVARNRVTDLFRRRQPAHLSDPIPLADDPETLHLEDILPSSDGGPEAVYARKVLLSELEDALAELPAGQRAVFFAHELEGKGFQQLAAETGLKLNTLLSRKRYAVLHLRRRLKLVYREYLEK